MVFEAHVKRDLQLLFETCCFIESIDGLMLSVDGPYYFKWFYTQTVRHEHSWVYRTYFLVTTITIISWRACWWLTRTHTDESSGLANLTGDVPRLDQACTGNKSFYDVVDQLAASFTISRWKGFEYDKGRKRRKKIGVHLTHCLYDQQQILLDTRRFGKYCWLLLFCESSIYSIIELLRKVLFAAYGR